MLGNFLTSAVAAIGTYLWMLIFGIPYPILLALLVALLDLIPVIGSTVAGTVVTLVALTVSVPIAIATAGFYVAYRVAEDYLLVPRVVARTVQLPAVASILAVLVGGALMGIIGALVAIPAAAAIRLLLQEITFRRLTHAAADPRDTLIPVSTTYVPLRGAAQAAAKISAFLESLEAAA